MNAVSRPYKRAYIVEPPPLPIGIRLGNFLDDLFNPINIRTGQKDPLNKPQAEATSKGIEGGINAVLAWLGIPKTVEQIRGPIYDPLDRFQQNIAKGIGGLVGSNTGRAPQPSATGCRSINSNCSYCNYGGDKRGYCWRNRPCGSSTTKAWCTKGSTSCAAARNVWLQRYACKTGTNAATGCRNINSNCWYCNYGGDKKGYCWRNKPCGSSSAKTWCSKGTTSCDAARRVWLSRYACKSSGGGTSGVSPAKPEQTGCRKVRDHCYYCNYGGAKKGYCWKNNRCNGGPVAWCVQGSTTCTTAMNVWARKFGCPKKSSSSGGGSSSSGGIIKTGCGCSFYPRCNKYTSSTCKNCCLSNCRATCKNKYGSRCMSPHTRSGHCYCNFC